MLLPWYKTSTIALGANGIALKEKGVPPKTLLHRDLCDQTVNNVIDALLTVSNQIQTQSVRFIVSNHFVRYAVIPWKEGITTRQEWVAFAEHAFRKSYGNVAEQWTVRVALNRYGQSVVASALDHTLVDALQALSLENNWKISAIEPFFMTVLNRTGLQSENTWVLLGEPERVILAQHHRGEWKNFTMINPPSGMEAEQSKQLLLRALSQLKTDARPKQVFTYFAPNLANEIRIDGLNIQSKKMGEDQEKNNSALWMVGI